MDTAFPTKNSVKAIKHHPSNQQLKKFSDYSTIFFKTLFNLEQSKKKPTNPSYFKSTGKNVMHPV